MKTGVLEFILLYSLGVVGIAILAGAARVPKSFRSVLLLGAFGGFLMAINCALLALGAGIGLATNGDESSSRWFRWAVACSIAALVCYFIVALHRLSKTKKP